MILFDSGLKWYDSHHLLQMTRLSTHQLVMCLSLSMLDTCICGTVMATLGGVELRYDGFFKVKFKQSRNLHGFDHCRKVGGTLLATLHCVAATWGVVAATVHNARASVDVRLDRVQPVEESSNPLERWGRLWITDGFWILAKVKSRVEHGTVSEAPRAPRKSLSLPKLQMPVV